ncbi:hypothetical protein [Nocardioides gilvus]|uniref:hypothetical protein n=1 Tax=Nocardioides gilvus TaxID=1735589 RepID=UPI000D7442FB|nr:hypothetical protein [Nocardioides gilvus]
MTSRTRRRAEGALVALVLTVPFALGAASADEPPEAKEAFTVTDHRIVESSGLTAQEIDGRTLFTTVNDSGDEARVFTLDPDTGDTAGVTTWSPGPRDIEALTPASDGHVWVGDIGDNGFDRASIILTRVPVGEGDRTARSPQRRELVYPDRPRDAEALLRHPQNGRLFVITKGAMGGQAYAVPPTDDGKAEGPQELVLEADVPPLVTDGAFLPSGDFVLLRNYTHAQLLSYPSWEVLGSFELPKQPQGEGLAVSEAGDIFISTEGRDRPVLRVELPPELQERTGLTPSGIWARLRAFFARLG